MLKVQDLNSPDGISLYSQTTVLGPLDVRSYLYWIKPKDENFKLDSSSTIKLGSLFIQWRNNMGDPGNLEVGPIEAKPKVKELEIDLNPVKEEVLKFEQP